MTGPQGSSQCQLDGILRADNKKYFSDPSGRAVSHKSISIDDNDMDLQGCKLSHHPIYVITDEEVLHMYASM